MSEETEMEMVIDGMIEYHFYNYELCAKSHTCDFIKSATPEDYVRAHCVPEEMLR